MKNRLILVLILLSTALMLTACGSKQGESIGTVQAATTPIKEIAEDFVRIKITAGNKQLTASLENNATTKALVAKFPLTIPMANLYARELCYHFDQALPTDSIRSDGYQVGDLIYWPPRHSFVILYKQNNERFSRQHLGRVDSGVDVLADMDNVNVKFELAD